MKGPRIPLIFTWTTIGVVVLVTAVVAVVLGTSSNVAANDGPLVRLSSQKAVQAGKPLAVTLTLSPQDLVTLCQAVSAPPMDVVLVLDHSDSMEGSPIQQASVAARRFVETIDLDIHHIGILFFSNRPKLEQTLTGDRSALLQVLDTPHGGGGTYIDSALNQVAQLLESGARRPGADGVVILLSDGGSEDVDATQSIAQQIKASGERIIVVALQGYDLNQALLRSVASSPGDYWFVEDAADLEPLYTALASEINRTLATDVVVTEPYNERAFAVADTGSADIVPGADATLLWQISALSPEGHSTSYVLRPQRLGWPRIAVDTGQVQMRDCQDTDRSYVTPSGPRVLVYPSPWWLLLLLLPLLLPWAGHWWNLMSKRKRQARRRADGQTAGSASQFASLPYAPPSYEWVETIGELRAADEAREQIAFPPTLIVGVGKLGRRILEQIKTNLGERCGPEFPSDVRLLAVEVQADSCDLGNSTSLTRAQDDKSSAALFASLDRLEQVRLTPNAREVERALQGDPEHFEYLAWWPQGGVGECQRALGRVALFYDLLHGTGNSKLWNALVPQMHGLERPQVFIVGALTDELTSGLVLDLPHLVRAAIQPREVGRVMLFLGTRASPDGGAQIAPSEFAALRELQRMMLMKRFPYQYGSPAGGGELLGSTTTTPLDACYLFDGASIPVDRQGAASRASPSLSLAIADALTTLIEPQVVTDFGGWTGGLLPEAGSLQTEEGEFAVGSVSSFLYRLPIRDIRSAAAYRLLLNVLFGEFDPSGRLGVARVLKSPGSARLDLDANRQDEQDLDQAVLTFLRSTHLQNRNPFASQLAVAIETKRWDEPALASLEGHERRASEAFLWSLQEQVTAVLNGDRDDPIANRCGKLGYTLAFLERLGSRLQEVERLAKAKGRVFRDQGLARSLAGLVAVCRQTATNALKEVQAWEEYLVGRPPVTGFVLPYAQQGSSQQAKAQPLYKRLRQEWDQARERLAHRAAQFRHEAFLDDRLEEPFYDRYLGSSAPGQVGLSPLAQATQRIGWWTDVSGGSLRLRMLVLPIEFNGQHSDPSHYVLGRGQGDRLLAVLSDLAHALSRAMLDEGIDTYLNRLGPEAVADQVTQGTEPLILYNKAAAGDIVASQERGYLALDDTAFGERVRGQIAEPNLRVNTRVVSMQDRYGCAAVRALNLLPMGTLDAYRAAEAAYYRGSANWHVHAAEQAAVALETRVPTGWGQVYRFHPRFVRLLVAPELLRVFARCYIYGLVQPKELTSGRRWILETGDPTLDIEILSGENPSLFEAAEAFVADLPLTAAGEHPLRRRNLKRTVQKLEIALDQRIGDQDWATRIENIEEEARLQRSTGRFWERDMGAYVEILTQDEMMDGDADMLSESRR